MSARRRAPARRVPKRRLYGAVALGVVFVLFLLSDGEGLHLPAGGPGLFQLRRVELVGLRRLEARSLVREHTALRSGLALFDVDPEQACATVLEHPRLRTCAGLRLPPGRLVLSVEEREPLAVDAQSGAGVDAEGVRFPLAPGEAETLPSIEGALAPALAVVEEARARGIGIARIEARAPEDVVVHLAEGPRLRIGPDPERSLSDWLRLLRSEVVARERAREVDLRFQGSAVLRDFEPKQGGS